ncbi:MAG: NADPH-dependent FMN reductase [Nocardioides sp.]|nr:NADPH-dependent FMN reductase [Nocardioides sp.]
MTRLVVVSAGLSDPSSTRLLADRLSEATVRALGTPVDLEVVELRPLAHAIADHLLSGFPPEPLADAITAVERADAVIAVTPVFTASYSGLFKSFLDVLPQGALAGTPVLVAATAGTARHSLVIEHALRPVFAYLRAVVVPTGVFAASEDFAHPALAERVERAAGELAALLGAGTRDGVRRPADAPRSFDEQVAEPTPFEELLKRASAAD